jgi:hypothetical protein
MAKRRLSIQDREQERGQGAEGYMKGLVEQHPETPEPRPSSASPKRKGVLVQLPEDLVRRRDKVWRARLEYNDKAEKSQIIEEALRMYLDKIEQEGDPYSHI